MRPFQPNTACLPTMGLGLVALVAACGDSTGPRQASPPVSYAGATVVHTVEDFFARVSDPQTGWSVYLGGTAEQLAEFCATGTFEGTSFWNEVAVIRPNGAVHFRDRARDLPVVVYDAPFYEVCDSTEPVFATGAANAVYTDNDFFFSGPGAFSFGFTGSGLVSAPSGEQYRLHFVARTHGQPDGEFKENAKVTLRPIH